MKPTKPREDFPLFPHANGQWAKKIAGKMCYFGPWDDPEGALARFLETNSEPTPKASELASNDRASKASNVVAGKAKPAKPHDDFPLYAHNSGRWAKKIRGRIHYFGPWNNPQAALDKYLVQKDDLLAGRTPRATAEEGCTVKFVVNKFLNSKKKLVASGELAPRSWDDYYTDCKRVIKAFGPGRLVNDLHPTDFERLRSKLAAKYSPVTLGNCINRIRVLFKYAYDAGFIERPMRYGQGFNRPSLKTLRIERSKKGKRMFEPEQIEAMIAEATAALKAMILLGINCGLGNTDCALLPFDVLDLDAGWIDYARHKTGIERRCPLWAETVAAIKDAIAQRPCPANSEHENLVFITARKRPWTPKSKTDCPISKETAKLLKRLKIKRPGLNFYALRHTFQTIGERSRDEAAVKFIMGHAPNSNDMASVYREEMTDERLLAVVNTVRDWLFKSTQSRLLQDEAVASSAAA